MSTPRTPLVVVGDALLDHDLCGRAERLAPDAPVPVVHGTRRSSRPGGAALAACLAASDGRPVTLVTALGTDPASDTLRELLSGRVTLVEVPLEGALSSKTRVLAGDRPLLRLDDGDGRARETTGPAVAAVTGAGGVLVADYGRGTADVLRAALTTAAAEAPVVWDPHVRGRAPVPGVRLATPSAQEARAFARRLEDGWDSDEQAGLRTAARDARTLVRAWRARAVAVTLGERGTLLSHGETPLLVPTPAAAVGDPCGAGDRFAATAAALLADGALTEAAVQEAVHAATRYVAEGGARALAVREQPDAPEHVPADGDTTADAVRTATRVRAAGGTLVAAGGCFDLLHAGHVALLQAARRAGDCLIVCVNSDDSVRRRKGGGRPLVPVADRVRVLRALECVDAVAVFDDDTPERILGELRPHIWAKGGDYARTPLPEQPLVESWGGQVLLLPYLDGRSTTGLARRAALSPAPATGPAR
ncbi:rfaE bifunctional protein, domain I/rfaE bifunctional protein, domain II [Streptomyces sp. 1222.5]|uniref:PfkB family carbohydrate kinase n=1 Tax=unclassified Streptomyces TaxID=2593676 RepID=UPI00089BB3A6|nr:MULTISPECIES: PfkB family carbohydrate kinase [unclassified Streptomyces]PKW06004.1 rfaE bifunctional protein kinase chain/domain/rfaE bifunctional protein nucleotidyltransferase chain/domain [Streptomyces sp. 5112.2]SED23434.1 rfaE bifunctional protein, domain I/rfaE bifunctional protein, domain II [Streptomyces sp. 1222.5]